MGVPSFKVKGKSRMYFSRSMRNRSYGPGPDCMQMISQVVSEMEVRSADNPEVDAQSVVTTAVEAIEKLHLDTPRLIANWMAVIVPETKDNRELDPARPG